MFSVCPTYASKFGGSDVVPYADVTWNSKAALQCQFFTWLAMWNRCWTSVRLTKRGLPTMTHAPSTKPTRPLTIYSSNASSHDGRSVWHMVWSAIGNPDQAPTVDDNLVSWCDSKRCGGQKVNETRAILFIFCKMKRGPFSR